MSPALARAIARWRATAKAVVTSADSTPSQRALAWAFLRKWGVA